MGLRIPVFWANALRSNVCFTKGSSHRLMISTCGAVLSSKSSNTGQMKPVRPLMVIMRWTASKAWANVPHESSVVDPLSLWQPVLGTGSFLDKVSRFSPKRKSEAASMVNLAKRSWILQGSSREERFDNTVIVRPAYFSNNSKSDMRLRVKKGRASERCYNESPSAINNNRFI